jgi:peptidoglycan/LPS O-acetylase OafA/YrhL
MFMTLQVAGNKSINRICERQYFLDWVRITAFAYLFFYHTAMLFVDWKFHIESGHNSLILKTIMVWSSQWRLDILFFVSGVAISHMTMKMPLKVFALNRFIKLYLPLLFSIGLLVAPQSYYEALQKGVFEGSFWQFWTSLYFSFSWDQRVIAPFPTYNHMWYVLYLFHYSLLLVPLLAFLNSKKGSSILARLEGWLVKGLRVIWLPLTLYFAIYLMFDNHDVNHTFYSDWYGHSIFIFAVFLGISCARLQSVWQAFEKNRYFALALGIISLVVLLMLFILPNETLMFDKFLVWGLICILVKWLWIATIIGFAKKHLNYTNDTLVYCNSLVYPFFILHQTIIIMIGYYVIDWGLAGAFEFLVIVVSSIVVCSLLYESLIKRVNIFRLLFGLKWRSGE